MRLAVAILGALRHALDPGLDLGRDLGEHVRVAVEAVHPDSRVPDKLFTLVIHISIVIQPSILHEVEWAARVPASGSVMRGLVTSGAQVQGADSEEDIF